MLHFMQLKVYKRYFALYISIITVLCTILIFILIINVRNNQIDNYIKSTSNAFINVESSLDGTINNIDNYYADLYSNYLLKEDFHKFLKLNINSYMEERLNKLTSENIYTYSYLDSINDLARQNDKFFDYIIYYNGSSYLISDYSSGGQVRYYESSSEDSEALLKKGYAYTKELSNDDIFIGTVTFILNPINELESVFRNSIGGAFLIQENDYIPLNNTRYNEDEFRYISSLGMNHGSIDLEENGDSYFYVSTSETFNFKVIAMVEENRLISMGAKSLFIYIASIIMIFLLITFFIIFRFSRDASFIEDILRFIDLAKKGDFSNIKVDSRNDEFSLIANQLNDMSNQLEAHIKKEYVLKIKQHEAEMKALITHINPHFLYNTLERIRMQALASNNPFIAKATANLGQLYRSIVKTNTFISLEKELAITEEYLELMSFLQEGELLYHIDVAEGCLKLETVKMWMQPIVENFFKHNFKEEDLIKIIIIAGEEKEDNYSFSISSNLGFIEEVMLLKLNSLFSSEENLTNQDSFQGGIGLLNIYSRLSYFYGNRIKMSISNNHPSGILINVIIEK